MTIEIVDPTDLHIHPLLKNLPRASSELEESILLDLDERGQDYPLIVDASNGVLDGRVRLRAASRLKWDEIKIQRVDSAVTGNLLVKYHLNRTHYSKSGRAYVGATLLFPARVLNSAQNAEFGSVPSAAQVLRVSVRLVEQAIKVHRLFAAHPETKEQIEAAILNDDLSLGYAVNGITGLVETKGKSRARVAEQLELFTRVTSLFDRRLKEIATAPESVRIKAARGLAATVGDWFPEARREVFRALKALQKKGAVS